MYSYVLPSIGSSGLFKIAAPFNATIRPDEKYTVKAIRTISELESNGIDVKKTRYIDNGLTESNYNDDLLVDMHIVTMQSGYGQWYEVPARYIEKFPRIDGVAYTRRNIVVQIPFVEKGTDYTLLMDDIKQVAMDHIGAEVGVAQVEVSTSIILSEQEHAVKKAQRKLNKNLNPSQLAINKELRSQNQLLRDKIAMLENYIISKGL